MKPARRVRRTLWSVVILLALIGIAVVVRRTINLIPILITGYRPTAATSNPVAARLLVVTFPTRAAEQGWGGFIADVEGQGELLAQPERRKHRD